MDHATLYTCMTKFKHSSIMFDTHVRLSFRNHSKWGEINDNFFQNWGEEGVDLKSNTSIKGDQIKL